MKNTFTTHSCKILSLVLAIAIIISMLPVTAFAETAPDDNAYATSGVTASGTQEDAPIDNPTTGDDGTGMYIPPVKAQPQDFTVADSIVEAIAADGVLKPESNSIPAAITGNAAGNESN